MQLTDATMMTSRRDKSACVAAWQQQQRPDDEYLAVSQGAIRRTLPALAAIPPQLAEQTLRSACGLGPSRC